MAGVPDNLARARRSADLCLPGVPDILHLSRCSIVKAMRRAGETRPLTPALAQSWLSGQGAPPPWFTGLAARLRRRNAAGMS